MRQLTVLLVWSIAVPWTLPSTGSTSQIAAREPDIATSAEVLAGKAGQADGSEHLPIDSPWSNPTLILELKGLFIQVGTAGPKTTTDTEALARDLASLPASAWQLGRVVTFARTARTFSLIKLEGMPKPLEPPDPRAVEAQVRALRVVEILRLLDIEVVHAPVN